MPDPNTLAEQLADCKALLAQTAAERDAARAEVARLREALEPIVAAWSARTVSEDGTTMRVDIPFAYLRKAHTALSAPAPPDPRDVRIAQLWDALDEWRRLAHHLHLSTIRHLRRTDEVLASTHPGEWLEEQRRKAMQRMVNIAKGCHDYRGGYRRDSDADIFHHGIQTVINALEGRIQSDGDTQANALEIMGRADDLENVKRQAQIEALEALQCDSVDGDCIDASEQPEPWWCPRCKALSALKGGRG